MLDNKRGGVEMTNREQLAKFLSENRYCYCDDCLSQLTNVRPRMQVNQICNGYLDLFERHENLACHNCGKIKITRSIKG